MSRENIQREAQPQLVAEVRMYGPKDGGRTGPAQPGWSCPVFVSKTEPLHGWDALPLLRDEPLYPGDKRDLGFVFFSGQEAADALKEAGSFYLWEGCFIGEATVIG
jgi:hypothetical protein